MLVSKLQSVCAILIRREEDLPPTVLLQHSRLRGWQLIGGKVDPGESHENAIYREINEEVGVPRSKIASLSLITGINHDNWVSQCYIGNLLMDAEPRIAEPDKVNGLWYATLQELMILQRPSTSLIFPHTALALQSVQATLVQELAHVAKPAVSA